MKPLTVVVQKRIRHLHDLRRVGFDKDRIRARQVQNKDPDYALQATNNIERFAKVDARVARRMGQRYERLAAAMHQIKPLLWIIFAPDFLCHSVTLSTARSNISIFASPSSPSTSGDEPLVTARAKSSISPT